ncbi:hypothetical protein ACFL50_03020 [Candidatus Latescibacterota bacterium]
MKDELGVRKQKLTFACPQCGKEITETVARLEDEDNIPCPNCNVVFKTDKFNVSGVIDESINDLRKFIRDLNKRL